MAWRSVAAILSGAAAAALLGSPAVAASIEAGAGVVGGSVNGQCVFTTFQLPTVND